MHSLVVVFVNVQTMGSVTNCQIIHSNLPTHLPFQAGVLQRPFFICSETQSKSSLR